MPFLHMTQALIGACLHQDTDKKRTETLSSLPRAQPPMSPSCRHRSRLSTLSLFSPETPNARLPRILCARMLTFAGARDDVTLSLHARYRRLAHTTPTNSSSSIITSSCV